MDDFPSSAAQLLEQKMAGKQTQDPWLATNNPSSIPAKSPTPRTYAAVLKGPLPAPRPTPLTIGALSRLNCANLEQERRSQKSWNSNESTSQIKEWVCRLRAMQKGQELLCPEKPFESSK